MEALIAPVVLVLLAIPLLLVVALVMIAGLRRRVAALESAMAAAPTAVRPAATAPRLNGLWPHLPATIHRSCGRRCCLRPRSHRCAKQRPPGCLSPSCCATARAAGAGAAAVAFEPALPNVIERGIGAVKRWFTEGNVPVKIGMLVLLAGVAALLKYVSDQGWLVLPIELRLAGVTVAALGLLAFGWHQRERRQLFALALQGGAIGVLLLTIFAAFKRFDLIPPAFAFASSIALVAGLCVLAVVQNSRTLAVLGILAGFMAPLWLSTGSGNHVGLFSYYAVLNAASLPLRGSGHGAH